jgi:hypothetical protein
LIHHCYGSHSSTTPFKKKPDQKDLAQGVEDALRLDFSKEQDIWSAPAQTVE